VGGLPTGTVNGFAVHPTNAKLMYVAMREGIFRSEDGGGRWTAAAGGPKNAAAIAVHPTRPTEVYVATTEGHIVISRDAGGTWAAVQGTQ
jgi:photosystem II stability/assembly factor-like uncharacterized protein